MPFISYAQNYEDVMLMRAFRDISNGFYIDVGAERPEDESVTKAFYDRGWSGINIEPVRQYYDMLAWERSRDINLQCFAGESISTREFFEVADTGLSTGLQSLANTYATNRVTRHEVQQLTLDEICRVHEVKKVHFLKIDAEGAEREVLAGFSLKDVRPWILVIEARVPNSSEPNYSEWEFHLLNRQYEFVWDDGINRFYVATEHRTLANHFKLPPNFFDNFDRLNFVRMRNHVDLLVLQIELFRKREAALSQREATFREHEAAFRAYEAAFRQREAELEKMLAQQSKLLEAVYRSTSWRIAAPIRIAGSLVRRMFRQAEKPVNLADSIQSDVLSERSKEAPPEQAEELSEYAQWIYDRLK